MNVKKSKSWYWLLMLTVLSHFVIIGNGLLAVGESEIEKFSLESALSYAMDNSPVLGKIRFEKREARLLLDEVQAKSILPEFSLSAETGVVPEARGDIFDSPDKQTDLDGWGPFIKLELKLVQPIFTFGRRSSAISAAKKGIDLQQIKGDSEIEQLRLAIIKAYYSLAAAREAEQIASDVKEKYKKLESEVKKRLESLDSEVDDTDLLEVKSNRYLIEEMVIKSRYQGKLAERSFNVAIGRTISMRVEVLDEKTPDFSVKESQVSQLVRDTLSQNRDIKGLDIAIQALHAKMKLAYSQKKPLIYLAGGFAYGYAPGRDDQTNPFAVDNFNYMDLGVYVGMQWDLNFFRKNIDAKRSQLEKKSLEQNLKLLTSKIELDILKAYADVDKSIGLLEQARFSLKAAKNWLRLSMDNWDMGIGEVERLIKAYNAYYKLKGVEIERNLDVNLSLVNFAYILGNTRLYLEWVKNEKVEIF